MDKNTLRKEMLEKRSALTPQEVRETGEAVYHRLLALEVWQQARTVMLYRDYRKEIPTQALIEAALAAGKTVVLPYTSPEFVLIPCIIPSLDQKFFRRSSMGILEPDPEICDHADPQSIDLVINPGVAFDRQGNRIGFGKGCYDRFLPLLRPETPKIAPAYAFQVVDSLPAEATDIPMDALLMKDRLLTIKGGQ